METSRLLNGLLGLVDLDGSKDQLPEPFLRGGAVVAIFGNAK